MARQRSMVADLDAFFGWLAGRPGVHLEQVVGKPAARSALHDCPTHLASSFFKQHDGLRVKWRIGTALHGGMSVPSLGSNEWNAENMGWEPTDDLCVVLDSVRPILVDVGEGSVVVFDGDYIASEPMAWRFALDWGMRCLFLDGWKDTLLDQPEDLEDFEARLRKAWRLVGPPPKWLVARVSKDAQPWSQA